MTGVILEVASGSGEHIVHFARNYPALVFPPSDPEPDALMSVAAWVKEAHVTNVRVPIVLDASQSFWPIASADGIICINMVHISPWEATLGLIKGAARYSLRRHRSISTVHTYAKGSQRPRAIRRSIGAFAIAARPGVGEISKRLLRWRNPGRLFLQRVPEGTIARRMSILPLRRREDRALFVGGLRQAGVPE